MPAPMKLRGKRERRLLALLAFGESLSAASRAIGVSTRTVKRHRRADPVFDEAVRAARENRVPAFVPIEPMDWREVARRLEASDPLRWALRGDPLDAFAAFDFDPLAP
jgi:hypothetical protein